LSKASCASDISFFIAEISSSVKYMH
jgi:hypothetical protein